MKQLFTEIKKMKIGVSHDYLPPNPRSEKQTPATIHLNFPSPLTMREIENGWKGSGLEVRQRNKLITATGHGVRIHITGSQRPLIQIQAEKMEEKLPQPQRAKLIEFLVTLPSPRRKNMEDRVLDLVSKLLR